MRGPNRTKAARGAACPMAYPISAAMPAQVPASAGLNSIQAPMTEATSVAVATGARALFRATRYSSMFRRLRLTLSIPAATNAAAATTAIAIAAPLSIIPQAPHSLKTEEDHPRESGVAFDGREHSSLPFAGITQIRSRGRPEASGPLSLDIPSSPRIGISQWGPSLDETKPRVKSSSTRRAPARRPGRRPHRWRRCRRAGSPDRKGRRP